MAQKPSLPKGTRDFTPEEVARRNYIFQTIAQKFQLFGFQPIETPSFENYETLMGKYGEEGDRLIFKILNSGDYLSELSPEELSEKNSHKLTAKICEKALRYDLTVPFARYVVMHQNQLTMPFKRYQIQPVWRADRPQRGRFREFYQCDADVVGSQSLLQETELIQLYDSVFSALHLYGVTIKINNRKILSGFAQLMEQEDKLTDFTVALDKLDKIGEEKVIEEMLQRGISPKAIDKISPIFKLSGSFSQQLSTLKQMLQSSEVGLKGIEELAEIYRNIQTVGLETAQLALDVTLARGLNYYTGAIFEVTAPQGITMGSIGGGGRYDNLTEIFGLKNISGVGISFGLDRMALVMEEMGLFPTDIDKNLDVLLLHFGEKEALVSLQILKTLRQAGLRAELYPENSKLKKQMSYADKRHATHTIMVGEAELQNGSFVLKEMTSGQQQTFPLEQVQAVAQRIAHGM